MKQKEKHAVLAFGRMNPITNGHEKVVKTVKKIAKQVGGSHHIVLSHTQDAKKNPLSAAQKLKHARNAFPDTNFSAATKEAPNFFDAAEKLYKQGVTHLHMVAGSDRAGEYNRLFQKYNGTHKGARFNFDYIGIESSGDRDPDAEGVEGISASKMREAASKGDFNTFKKGAPSTMSITQVKQMYNDVRKGMQLKEEFELNENDSNRFSKYIMKVTKTEPKIVRKTNPSGRTTDHVEYEVHGTVSSQKRTFKSKKEAEAYYNTVKEDINIDFQYMLDEGVHDKSIFKAVFLGGGPGSGKDFVLDKTLSGHGLVEINSDKALEYLMDKNNLDMRMPENETEARDVVRGRAKSITELRQRLALFGRNGVIINGTGDDPEKITKIKERLEELGYDTSMVMVNTKDEVSQQRNIERGQRGGRTVPEKIRKNKWDAVQNARPKYAEMFGDAYTEFDNSEDLRSAPPEVVEAKENEMLQIFKKVQSFVKKPPKSKDAKSWIASELESKDSLQVDKKAPEMVPHPSSGAADEARKLGLQYYGFGRYGKNGQVTHRSIHDKLTAITKQPSQDVADVPVSGSSMSAASVKPQGKTKERLQKIQKASPLRKLTKEDYNQQFENLLSETITLSISADTPEEINSLFRKMIDKTDSVKSEETYELSSSDARNVLTLGKKTTVSEFKTDNMTFSNDDIEKILEERKTKYITDVHGKPRVFMLRRAAAKEAHQKNGSVVPHEKGGYLVKLKEETNDVEISERHILSEETGRGEKTSPRPTSSYRGYRQYTEATREETRGATTLSEEIGSSKETSTKESTESICEENHAEKGSTKITLSKIRAKQKEKVTESIDKGTEAGVSMAGSGESIGRDMGEKNNKRGKAVPVKNSPINELTGDETGASIGDQKEDELKKKGISLLTFKKRNFV
jgi:hypothetical protein